MRWLLIVMSGLLIALAYGAWKTQGFKKPIEFKEVE